jgi:pimeloyl-ACP methyl ester carboxylesterase
MFLFQLPYLPERLLMVEDLDILRKMFEGKISDEHLEAYKYTFGKQGNIYILIDIYQYVIQKMSSYVKLNSEASWTPPLNYYRNALRYSNLVNPGEFPRVIQPTLIIWGENDIALDKELPILSAAFGDDISIQFVEANHFVHAQKPEEVNRLIEQFVR